MAPSAITGATGNQEFFLHRPRSGDSRHGDRPRRSMISEIIVLGAGAIGSVYAAKLAARHPVTADCAARHTPRRSAPAALRIIGREPATRAVSRRHRGRGHRARTRIILLTTKVNDSRRAIAPLVDQAARRHRDSVRAERTGQRGHREARRSPAGALVLRAITAVRRHLPGARRRRFHRRRRDTLLETSPRSAEIAALLGESGLDGRVSPNIQAEIWRKLIFNCVINPITAIVGIGGRRHRRSAARSAEAAGHRRMPARSRAADGVAFDIDFLPTITEVFGTSRTIASMRQDLMQRQADRDRAHERRRRRARPAHRHRLPGQRRARRHHQGDGALRRGAITGVPKLQVGSSPSRTCAKRRRTSSKSNRG